MNTWQADLTARVVSAAKITANAAAHVSRAVAQEVVHGVVGAQCLLDYTLEGQVASSGPWAIFSARAKKPGLPHPLVSAWVLEKRDLAAHEPRGSRRAEQLLQLCRREVQQLTRLKHPFVVRVVASLEETRTMLVFITEAVSFSLEDVLRGGALLPALALERRQLRMSELEIKHGLLQLAEALQFLHHDAALVHQAVCPQTVLITTNGAWKLAGFGHVRALADYNEGGQLRQFDYSNPAPSPMAVALQPPLPYTAPELATWESGAPARLLAAADVFSLAALAFELVARRQLLPVGHSLREYESTVHSLVLVDLTGAPRALEGTLRQMLAKAADARPPVASFAGSSFFVGDVQLRALRFLETMLQRDPLQRAAFLRDLPAMLTQWDSRVLKTKVLPPLLQELRTPELQPGVLPLVLNIVGHQSPQEFADSTLPALQPMLDGALGDSLLLLLQHAPLLAAAAPKSVVEELLSRLLVRGCQHGDARAQEEALKQAAALADALDYVQMKRLVLPATFELCLSTTSASVRVAAFETLAAAASRTGRAEAEAMLAVAAQVVAVDKSAPTAMCVLGLGEALARQWGATLAAERVLPALTPLLVMPSLSAAQFATALSVVKSVLGEIERSRGAKNGGGGRSSGVGANGANGLLGDDDWMGAAAPMAPAPACSRAVPLREACGVRAAPAALASPLDLSGLALKAKAAAGPGIRTTAGSSDWTGPDTAFVSAVPAPRAAVSFSPQAAPRPSMRAPARPSAAADPFADLPIKTAAPTPSAAADPFDSLVLQHAGVQRSAGANTGGSLI